jgi:hypothetical protein
LVENQKFSQTKYRRFLLVVLVGILELPGGVGIRVVHRLLLVRVVDEIVLLCGGLRSALKRDITKNQCCGSGSGIRDWGLFDPWVRDPGSGIGLFRIPDPKLIFLRAY